MAVVLVALAVIGGTPRKTKVGNEMKLPPPAAELTAPATAAAAADTARPAAFT
jgi:hypothetical protein